MVTRVGIISWIEGEAVNIKDASIVTALARAVYDSSDKERVDTWSGRAILPSMEEIGAGE